MTIQPMLLECHSLGCFARRFLTSTRWSPRNANVVNLSQQLRLVSNNLERDLKKRVALRMCVFVSLHLLSFVVSSLIVAVASLYSTLQLYLGFTASKRLPPDKRDVKCGDWRRHSLALKEEVVRFRSETNAHANTKRVTHSVYVSNL